MENYMLELKNISKEYDDGGKKRKILNDISLQIEAGELVAIVGPSGSGKSTFLTIAGLLRSADGGQVMINGEDLSKANQKTWTRLRKEHVGFIYQNHELFPYLTAKEQLTAFQDKKYRDSIKVEELLSDLDLSECAERYPGKLSGGEKQRVSIARAFVNNPEIILADEPTASLDKERGRQAVEMIRKEVKKHGKAAIMVTHDERVLDLADRVYRLEDGTLTSI